MRVSSCSLCLPSTCFSKSSPAAYSSSLLQSGGEAAPSSDGGAAEERSSCGDCVLLEGKEKRPLADRASEEGLADGECEEGTGCCEETGCRGEFGRCGGEIVLKSSLRKPREPGGVEARKGRVKWMDILGKELVDIHEFEASESEDSDVDCSDRSCCSCVIQ